MATKILIFFLIPNKNVTFAKKFKQKEEMVSFLLSLVALVLGYLFYGKFVAHVFGPNDRPTPAVTKADGVDFIVLPSWKSS